MKIPLHLTNVYIVGLEDFEPDLNTQRLASCWYGTERGNLPAGPLSHSFHTCMPGAKTLWLVYKLTLQLKSNLYSSCKEYNT